MQTTVQNGESQVAGNNSNSENKPVAFFDKIQIELDIIGTGSSGLNNHLCEVVTKAVNEYRKLHPYFVLGNAHFGIYPTKMCTHEELGNYYSCPSCGISKEDVKYVCQREGCGSVFLWMNNTDEEMKNIRDFNRSANEQGFCSQWCKSIVESKGAKSC